MAKSVDSFNAYSFSESINRFPKAFYNQSLSADLRTFTTDFKVTEILGFEPCGEGEHLFLEIEKADCNTEWVARQLQRKSSLSSREVSYAGKKDRHSLSTQWFSLHLPGKQIDLESLASDQYKIIRSIRHNKKLRRGNLLENQFEIILRNLNGKIDSEIIEKISFNGVPNYFGRQRFGFEGNNLDLAEELLNLRIKIKNRDKKGLILSSARSYLFNLMLARRVSANNWLTPLSGDCMMLDQSRSYFVVDNDCEKERVRLSEGDIHVCGFLAGKQLSDAKNEAKKMENDVLENFTHWISGLEHYNLDSDRRAYRCIPKNLMVEQKDKKAVLKFALPKGSFATSVIREMVDVQDVAVRK